VAVNNYEITATTTVAPGTAATVVAGEPGTAGAAGYGSEAAAAGTYADVKTLTFLQGQVIRLDRAGQLYTLLNGLGVLRLLSIAQETGGTMGTSN
jgi:hypothetical protein